MTIAATPVPLSEAKARLSELARRVRQQHERITLTRNGEPEAVLVSVDDLEGMEMTLGEDANRPLSIIISLAALAGIVAAVYISKQRSTVIDGSDPGTPAEPPAPPAAPADEAPTAPVEPEPTAQFEPAEHPHQ